MPVVGAGGVPVGAPGPRAPAVLRLLRDEPLRTLREDPLRTLRETLREDPLRTLRETLRDVPLRTLRDEPGTGFFLTLLALRALRGGGGVAAKAGAPASKVATAKARNFMRCSVGGSAGQERLWLPAAPL